VAYSLFPEEVVEHDQSSGHWRYYRSMGIAVTQSVLGLDGSVHSIQHERPRNSMSLTGWMSDDSPAADQVASYISRGPGHDAGLWLSFHGHQVGELVHALGVLQDTEPNLHRSGAVRCLQACLDDVVAVQLVPLHLVPSAQDLGEAA